MKYYSTNKQAPEATLEEAVVKGLAADKGLFMPFTIKTLPQEFYDSIDTLSFQEIAYRVADAFFGEDVSADTLKQIVYDTLSFDVPLVRVTEIFIRLSCSMVRRLPLRMWAVASWRVCWDTLSRKRARSKSMFSLLLPVIRGVLLPMVSSVWKAYTSMCSTEGKSQ